MTAPKKRFGKTTVRSALEMHDMMLRSCYAAMF